MWVIRKATTPWRGGSWGGKPRLRQRQRGSLKIKTILDTPEAHPPEAGGQVQSAFGGSLELTNSTQNAQRVNNIKKAALTSNLRKLSSPQR